MKTATFFTLTLLLFLLLSASYADSQAYIQTCDGEIIIGNVNIERAFKEKAGKYFTAQIVNKRSGRVYKLHSNEFKLDIVFAGVGPAPGKAQNGDNLAQLTVSDFSLKDYKILDRKDGEKVLRFEYSFTSFLTAFQIAVNYSIKPGDFYIRKWIEIADSSDGLQFLDRIYLESMVFDMVDFSHGDFGQPVFIGDLFIGVEYPGCESRINGKLLETGYLAGKKITDNGYVSDTSVVGAGESSETLERAFLEYIDKIKVHGKAPFILYNSWYDFRNPSIAKDSASIMNPHNIFNRIATFKKIAEKYDLSLDAFVLDDGWDNYNSIWEIDSSRFPQGFTPIVDTLQKIQTSLGLWASPFGGYSHRYTRIAFGKSHGYETIGNEFYCLAGKRYSKEFINRVVQFAKDYKVGYFKWDGLPLACNEPNHGHLPGLYSREAIIRKFIEAMQSIRTVNPNIFINITIGTWLSPWWLKYANSVWMQGEDYAYAEEVPCINDRDKSITYRDAVLFNNFRKQDLIFPMSGLMTHGIIKGRLNFLGGKNESLESFSNEVLMYLGRGVTMWELYISPDLLNEQEWHAIAQDVKWAKQNMDVLLKTKMILGDPLKGEVYGYIHLTRQKGIILLRNPDIEPKTATIKLSPELGELDPDQYYVLRIIYPYQYITGGLVKANSVLHLPLNGYEILAAELVPVELLDKNLPVETRFALTSKGGVILYGKPGTKAEVHSLKGDLLFKGKYVGVNDSVKVIGNIKMNDDNYQKSVKMRVYVPHNYKDAQLGFLIQPAERLNDTLQPNFSFNVGGKEISPKIQQENVKWFWVIAKLDSGMNDISFVMKLKKEVNQTIQAWFLGQLQMSSVESRKTASENERLLPFLPHEPSILSVSRQLIREKRWVHQMKIDLVAWSVWLVGFAVFVIWIWIPARELSAILKERRISSVKQDPKKDIR